MTTRNMQARKVAKADGSITYENGIPCPKGHQSARYVSGGNCVECMAAAAIKTNEKRRANTEAKRRQRASAEYRASEAERRKTLYAPAEWEAAVRRRSTKVGWVKHILHGAKYRAKQKGLDFTITADDLIVPDACPVLGVAFDFSKATSDIPRYHPRRPSLDRVDNNKGYVPGNVMVISYRANALKSDASLDDIRRVYDYMLSGGVP